MRLTDLEVKVLGALFESSRGNGHDFGFVEDVADAKVVGKDQLGGVISSLVKKKFITVYEPVRTDTGLWTQFSFLGHDDFARGVTLKDIIGN